MWSRLRSLAGICLPASRIPEASGPRASRRSAEPQAQVRGPEAMPPGLPLGAPVSASSGAECPLSPPAGSRGGAVPSLDEEAGSARWRQLPEGQLVITRTLVPLISELQFLSLASSHLPMRESPELNPRPFGH